MPFLALQFSLGELDAGAVEDACFTAGALAVTLSDAADQPIFEPALGTTPLWPRTQVNALFAAEANSAEIIATLQSSFGTKSYRFESIADRQWEREWLRDFHPLRFGRRLWVCPHGQEIPDQEAAAAPPVVVRLDPGLAFGTGTHPTTAMCLEWLDGQQLGDAGVIDYGCGSGILAIAALKLGARHAVGIDLDPQALLATRDNAERNSVGGRIATLLSTGVPQDPPRSLAPADIVLANILAVPLMELAPTLQALMKRGGRIALSGILEDQAQAVTAAYGPWFDMREFAVRKGSAMDSWVCLQGVRR